MRETRSQADLPEAVPESFFDEPVVLEHPTAARASGDDPPPRRPKLKKLRFALVFSGLATLGVISTVFGMMMAVTANLPSLEGEERLRVGKNSILYYDQNKRLELAKLTGNENRVLVRQDQISPNMKNAVIAMEDKRFYEHKGVDYRGIARALWQDLRQRRAAQGGSTITQQLVKNLVEAQQTRTVFQKLRESALAYHIERKFTKQEILQHYLNTVYFGNGAYGIEAAVRTYFRGGTETFDENAPPEAANVAPHEAALLAGIIASPSMYDPVQNPNRAYARRNLVLLRMYEQRMITRDEYRRAIRQAIPTRQTIRVPRPDSEVPYYSTWVTQQLLDIYEGNTGLVFGGGLKITTTIDHELQTAAEQAIAGRMGNIGPAAALVAIENKTGEIKAMVGGSDFSKRPFNLATHGHRQPGSAIKTFTLLAALQKGVSPGRTFVSSPQVFTVPGTRGKEKFSVENYESNYTGVNSVFGATVSSDNAVYAQLGLKVVGTRRIARLAQRMGIRTKISTNPAMVLGGLERGVTPLEMAYAYSTLANDGVRVSGSMSAWPDGPVAIEKVLNSDDDVRDENEKRTERVFPASVAQQAKSILAAVISSGTAKAAQIGEFAAGKTGTTENYGDAWFVGFNKELTVAVWVGYPDKLIPMETEYRGNPVAGGTYPAEIWQAFMSTWIKIRDARIAEKEGKDPSEVTTTTTPAPVSTETAPADTPPAETEGGTQAPTERRRDPAPAPEPQPAPQPTPEPQPPAQQQPPPAGDGGTETPDAAAAE